MREWIYDYTEPVRSGGGISYHARVCGATRDDGRWEGWVEFSPIEAEGPSFATHETEQSSAEDLAYWASGVTAIDLERALERAQSNVKVLDELVP